LVIALTAAGFCGLFIGTVIDLRARIIPDQMVLLVLAAGVSARVVADGWFAGWSLLIGFVLFLPLAAATHRGFIGGGDAKMIPAVTLLFEPPRVFGLLLGIAVAGGVLALIYRGVLAASA
jgi:prepilin peptidase CpaA